jgi:hypothetical protein
MKPGETASRLFSFWRRGNSTRPQFWREIGCPRSRVGVSGFQLLFYFRTRQHPVPVEPSCQLLNRTLPPPPRNVRSTSFARSWPMRWLRANTADGSMTRFPPEPNGYLHIGHAKSICLNFGSPRSSAASATCGSTTRTPPKEDQEYVDSIRTTSAGSASSGTRLLLRLRLLRTALRVGRQADQGARPTSERPDREECAKAPRHAHRAGQASPYRDRSVAKRTSTSSADEGRRIPRRQIYAAGQDRHGLAEHEPARPAALPHQACDHHRTGDKWCIYPLYDYTHGQSDSIEGSRTRSARSSSRTTARCTTGSLTEARDLTAAADRVRAAEPHLHQ